jgi:hypothetical protein
MPDKITYHISASRIGSGLLDQASYVLYTGSCDFPDTPFKEVTQAELLSGFPIEVEESTEKLYLVPVLFNPETNDCILGCDNDWAELDLSNYVPITPTPTITPTLTPTPSPSEPTQPTEWYVHDSGTGVPVAFSDSTSACGALANSISKLYTTSAIPSVGEFVFTYSDLSDVFIGNGSYYAFKPSSNVEVQYAIRINYFGEILDVVDCSTVVQPPSYEVFGDLAIEKTATDQLQVAIPGGSQGGSEGYNNARNLASFAAGDNSVPSGAPGGNGGAALTRTFDIYTEDGQTFLARVGADGDSRVYWYEDPDPNVTEYYVLFDNITLGANYSFPTSDTELQFHPV